MNKKIYDEDKVIEMLYNKGTKRGRRNIRYFSNYCWGNS